MNEYGIVYLLPDDVAKFHQELRLKIEEKFNLTGQLKPHAPTHITMKYRFQAQEITEVENVLCQFSMNQTPTRWSLKQFNTFVNDNNFVIFIDVEPSPETREAHRQFLKQLQQIDWMQWGEFDHRNLHYHITLAHRGLTPENFGDVLDFVHQQDSPNFDLFFNSLTLLKINNGIHQIYKTFLFSATLKV
jgi:2'-5' RNA ligase